VFDELKEFVLTEARVAQTKTLYDKEGDVEGLESTTPSTDAPAKTATTKAKAKVGTATPASAPTTSANDGGVADLAKKFEAMTSGIAPYVLGGLIILPWQRLVNTLVE
jgi:hypothetical protein